MLKITVFNKEYGLINEPFSLSKYYKILNKLNKNILKQQNAVQIKSPLFLHIPDLTKKH